MNTEYLRRPGGLPRAVYVYLLTFPNGKCYVGITRDMKKRLREHIRNSTEKRNAALFNAIRKHGIPKMDAIAVVPTYEEAFAMEKAKIGELGTLAPGGYNMTEGGDGAVGIPSDVRKRAAAKRRQTVSRPDIRVRLLASAKAAGPKVSAANKIFYSTAEGRAVMERRSRSTWLSKVTAANRKPTTDQKRAKMSAAMESNWNDPEYREKVNAAREARQAELRANPEWVAHRRAAMAAAMKAKWADPAFRAKMKAIHTSAEAKEWASRGGLAARATPLSPEKRASMREKVRAAALRQWSNPETRAVILSSIRRRKFTQPQPEQLELAVA